MVLCLETRLTMERTTAGQRVSTRRGVTHWALARDPRKWKKKRTRSQTKRKRQRMEAQERRKKSTTRLKAQKRRGALGRSLKRSVDSESSGESALDLRQFSPAIPGRTAQQPSIRLASGQQKATYLP